MEWAPIAPEISDATFSNKDNWTVRHRTERRCRRLYYLGMAKHTVVDVDRLEGGILITFGDQRVVHFNADVLYSFIAQGVEIGISDKDGATEFTLTAD